MSHYFLTLQILVTFLYFARKCDNKHKQETKTLFVSLVTLMAQAINQHTRIKNAVKYLSLDMICKLGLMYKQCRYGQPYILFFK
jgi:hypothetical protein